jgi:hypothetical protein
MSKLRYLVIRGIHRADLEDKVNEAHRLNGYKPTGGLCTDSRGFYQAMWLPDNKVSPQHHKKDD